MSALTNVDLTQRPRFTDLGQMRDVVTFHEKANQTTVNKFSIFCVAITSMLLKCRKKVFDAAVTASLLYSVELWFTDYIKSIEQQYNQLVRCLLEVRYNTGIQYPPCELSTSKV